MRRAGYLLLNILLVSGCGVFDKRPINSVPIDNISILERQERLQQITNWGLKGRISIRSSDDGASASIVWDQQGKMSEIRLFGAFGIGTLRIVQKPGNATLYRGTEKPLYGENAEKLLLWELGLRVPLSSLKEWLRGIEGDSYDATYDSYGRLKSLRYTDANSINWFASFETYRLVNGNHLPVRMTVVGGGVQIKLKTDSWNTEEPAENKTHRLLIPSVSSLQALPAT